jgi:hypothetical protein
MNYQFPSLITADADAGLNLAGQIAEELCARMNRASAKVERPGGTNYLLPVTVPKEVISSILFCAISGANDGWTHSA